MKDYMKPFDYIMKHVLPHAISGTTVAMSGIIKHWMKN